MALRNKQVLFSGPVKCDIYWANLNKENEMSGKFQYDLANLSGAAVAKLSELGVNIRTKGDERGNFLTSKSLYPIKTTDKDGLALDPAILVGNGSKGVAAIRVISGTNSFGDQVFVETQKLQINDLIEYKSEAAEEDATLSEDEAL
jgi:hypothetical protein